MFFNNDYLEIDGDKLLKGNIKISGAKNSALVLMASIFLRVKLIFNVPQISDVFIMSKILIAMGINIKSNEDELKNNIKILPIHLRIYLLNYLMLLELVFASAQFLLDLKS